VTVVVRRPGPPLAGLVTEMVYRTGEQSRTSVEKILPGAETGLWVNLNRDAFRSFDEAGRVHQVPGAMVSGPAGRATVVEFEEGHAHVSVAFALGAASCFLVPSLGVLRDELVPVESACGGASAFLRERLLEAASPGDALAVMEDFLLGQLADGAGPDPAVVAAAGALARGSRVAEVCEWLGVLPRTLRRRFTAQVGLSPKRFGRVRRLRRVVCGLDGQARVDWAATAARYGYCDQAHLADEFRELADVTPGEYLRSRVNGPNHLRFDVRA
jgi:AraC-like DNA-binding protein